MKVKLIKRLIKEIISNANILWHSQWSGVLYTRLCGTNYYRERHSPISFGNPKTKEEISKERKTREEFAERQMYEHCKAHNLTAPNHIIKDAFRIGFNEGIKYNDKYIKKLWLIILLILILLIAKCVF